MLILILILSVDPWYGTSSVMTQAAKLKLKPNRPATTIGLTGNLCFNLMFIQSLPDNGAEQ